MAEPSPRSLLDAAQAADQALGRAALELTPGRGPEVRRREEGWVRAAMDGVLDVAGLPRALMDELLHVEGGGRALVVGLDPTGLQAIALDDQAGSPATQVGTRVERAQGGITLPGGEAVLGRVLDPLGRPLDGSPLAPVATRVPLERRAPRIHERAAVHLPLLTGVLVVDAMFPIGRGQRELILGDEGTGKTALALEAVLAQRATDVVGVWVAIGRRRAEVAQVVEALRKGGGRWVVVAASEDVSPGLRFLAPYAGCAVAESFAWRGQHALIVYDHLSAHAAAWREVSLLLRRPPGREAFPGDVFHMHARLLERAAQLAPARGGGSLTALPIAITESGRVSGFVPTNLISITDGQLVLSQRLFAAGQKPAVDAGLSVSRVGGKAQPQALRDLAGRMRLDFAAFLELEAFTRLGTRLEPETQRRIDLGRRVRALLRAPRFAPLSAFEEVVRLLLCAAEGLLSVPEAAAPEVASRLAARLRAEHPHVARAVDRDGVLTTADRAALELAVAQALEAGRA